MVRIIQMYFCAHNFQFLQFQLNQKLTNSKQSKRLRSYHIMNHFQATHQLNSTMSIDLSSKSISSSPSCESLPYLFEMNSLRLFDNLLQKEPSYKISISTQSHEENSSQVTPNEGVALSRIRSVRMSLSSLGSTPQFDRHSRTSNKISQDDGTSTSEGWGYFVDTN